MRGGNFLDMKRMITDMQRCLADSGDAMILVRQCILAVTTSSVVNVGGA